MAVNLNSTSSWISFLFAAVSHKIGVVESCFNLLLKLTSISGWLSPPFGVESGQFGVKSHLNMQWNLSLVWFWIRLSHPNMAFNLLLNSLTLGYLVVESHFHLVVESRLFLTLNLTCTSCSISLPFGVEWRINLALNLTFHQINLVLNLTWAWSCNCLLFGVESGLRLVLNLTLD